MLRPANEPMDLSPLSALAPQLATTVASVASDVALVVDADGVIRNVAFGNGHALAQAEQWVGRSWADTVTTATRRKVEQLLREALDAGLARRREVNLPAVDGGDIPIAYSAIRLGARGPVLAVGRDLRAIAAIQQQFIDVQGEMERDYWKRRRTEARYRTLFEVATDSVFVVDAESLTIVDANAAAARLYDLAPDQLAGKRLTVGLDRASRAAVEDLLVAARSSARPAELRARLAGRRAWTRISATPFRSDGVMLLLVRAAAVDDGDGVQQLTALVERTPDGLILCDGGGHVRAANPAFVAMVGSTSDDDLRGQSLSQWLVPDSGSVVQLLAQVRAHGVLRAVGAGLTAPGGQVQPVELSAMLLTEGEQEGIGLIVRTAQPARSAALTAGLAGALTHLSSQLGLTALPALMQQVNQLAEQHFLQAALQRADGDAAAAARLLGLTEPDFAARRREQQGHGPEQR